MNRKLILNIFNSKLTFQPIFNEMMTLILFTQTISIRSAVMKQNAFQHSYMCCFVELAYKIGNCIVKVSFSVFLTVHLLSWTVFGLISVLRLLHILGHFGRGQLP